MLLIYLLTFSQSLHAEFSREQSGSGGSREAMLSKLASAFDAYKTLNENLEQGTKFYNDLTQVLNLI